MAVVLVVASDSKTQSRLAPLVERLGHDIVTAHDGHSAVSQAAARVPALVLLDLDLPDCHGLDLLRRLRSMTASAGARLVVVSRRSETREVVEAMRAGAFDYLRKPLREHDLAGIVRAALLSAEIQLERPPAAPAPVIKPRPHPRFVLPAGERVARAVVGVANHDCDIRTLAAWGRAIGASRGALRAWCAAAGVQSRAALALARVLRAVHIAILLNCPLEVLLDTVQPRTLHRLLRSGGIPFSAIPRDNYKSVTEFCLAQQYITAPAVVSELLRLSGRLGENVSLVGHSHG